MTGVRRLLKPGGLFVSMTFAQPHFRKPLLAAPACMSVAIHRHVEIGFRDCYIFHLRPLP